MNILMLDPSAYTPYYDHSLCKALAQAGCNVELITAPFIYDTLPEPELYQRQYGFARLLHLKNKLKLQAHPRLRKLLKALEYPLDWLALWRRIQFNPPDVIHVQWSVDPAMDAWWLKRLRQQGVPIVFTAHNIVPHPGEPTRRSGFPALYSIADAIIVLAEANRSELLTTFEIPAEKIHVVITGNLLNLQEYSMDYAEARKRLGLSEDLRAALFFGLIKPYKGLEVLIRAFGQVRTQVSTAKLIIVGQPNMSFDPFDKLIREQQLDNAVVTDLRYIPSGEIPVYFAAADVVVLPYLRASQSAVLLTAYTFGRPVITTDTGGLPEMVEQGRSGLIVPPSSETALAEALVAMLASPKRAQSMGEYAGHLARTRHAWSAIARSTIDVYQQVVNRSSQVEGLSEGTQIGNPS